MKTIIKSFKSLPGVVSLISVFVLSGCYQEAPTEELVSNGSSKLSVLTRSVTGNSIQYPLTVFAFDSDGKCKAKTVVEDDSGKINMKLADGVYRITSISGYDGFVFPSKESQSSLITTISGNYGSSPLSIGQADVYISGTSTTATLLMALQVASMKVSLNGLPDDIRKVSVSFANQYSSISLGGELTDPKKTEVVCEKKGDTWESCLFYLFPSSSPSTVLTITITGNDGVQTYGYNYNSPLIAGVPYVLNGSFSGDFTFKGFVEMASWANEVTVDFNFGPGHSNADDSGSQNSVYAVSQIPRPCSVWDGHIVALVDNETTTEADLLLLSLSEEENVLSGFSSVPNDASNIANAYSENGLTGWRMPTKEEATRLKNLYFGSNITGLNNAIESVGGKALTQTEKDKNVRYLCEDATYTYSFGVSSNGNSLSVSKAGESVKYRLRLVKSVHVITTPSL